MNVILQLLLKDRVSPERANQVRKATHPYEVVALKYSPNGQFLAVGSRDSNIYIFDAAKKYRRMNVLKGHLSAITALDWFMDNRRVLLFTSWWSCLQCLSLKNVFVCRQRLCHYRTSFSPFGTLWFFLLSFASSIYFVFLSACATFLCPVSRPPHLQGLFLLPLLLDPLLLLRRSCASLYLPSRWSPRNTSSPISHP